MSNERISVLICDDSALMRKLISKIIESSPEMEVAGTAMNGVFALQKIPTLKPDIMILDLEMPQMNGIEFLKERQRLGIDLPVVILSSIARRGAQVTMEALALGASDFIMKPSGSISEDIQTIGDHIIKTVKAYGLRYKRLKGHAVSKISITETVRPVISPVITEQARKDVSAFIKPPEAVPAIEKTERIALKPHTGQINVVAIGISTGGPNALRKLFAEIDPEIGVPILVVQHMPAGFTFEFAKSLDRICPLDVKEAAEGDLIKPGRVFIAPGDRHITIIKKPLANIIHLSEAAPMNGHRPSADVLFSSVSNAYGNSALAVIMTGMGKDGARCIGTIAKVGGFTLGQDEQSCVVYGMPKVAKEYGYLHEVHSLDDMAGRINAIVKEFRPK